VTGAIIVLILTLYFLASLRSIKKATYRFVPASKRPGFIDVSEDITAAVGRYVVGQVSLALVNGILSLIFLSIIGAPQSILLAFVAFLFSLIPLVGTLTGSIIISLVCLFASPLTALVAIIYYLIYMQVEAYVLSPRIMNRAVAVPGAVVVIAAVAGGTLGGILGALVAIPIAASAIIITQKVVFPRQDAK
jgi:predicted PurR-regulated permease PerM